MRRRDFLRRGTAAAAAFSIPYYVPSRVLAAPDRPGANDRFRVGFIGAGGRARQLMTHEKLDTHADIVAVADCFLPRIDEAAKITPGSEKWKRYQNYQDMLEKEKLDAVFVPTPTHARALICIHAMQAGLDVYAEKPIALTVQEGRALIRAVRKYKRVFQAGTQQRSIPINAWASKQVREGAIGKVKEVIACDFIGPERWKPQPAEAMPEGLDWDMWCNQTEKRDYHHLLQFGWARWWDYDGSGISYGVTGWGTHAFDQVQCALGTDDTGPIEVWPEGPGWNGNIKVTMKYPNGTLLKAHGDKRGYEDLGAIFVGEKGTIDIQRGKCVADPPELLEGAPPDTPAPAPGETVEHIRNFFDCIRSRKKPNAHVEAAHRSTIVCILMNVCRNMNRKLAWDPKAERFRDDDEANKTLSRPRRKGYELPKEFI
jgi:predicted dehydrogenase